MLRRRRPLLRAAAVGGAGYLAGKKMGERNSATDPGYEEPAATPAPVQSAPPASGMSNDSIARLKQPVYLGLGNHDYENNVNDCADNSCARRSVYWFVDHMSKLPLAPKRPPPPPEKRPLRP